MIVAPDMAIFMDDPLESLGKRTVADLGFDRLLNKSSRPAITPDFMHAFSQGVSPSVLMSGEMIGNTRVNNGHLESSNFVSGSQGWRINYDGTAEFQDINLGIRQISVPAGGDIQAAMDSVSSVGGGMVILRNGVHNLTADLEVPNNIFIKGENFSQVVLNFGGLNYSVKIHGSGAYSTGTISINRGSTTVTGSGTSWLANLTTGHMIVIDSYPYTITSIGSDTELTLSEVYFGTNQAGAAYYSAIFKQNIAIQNLYVFNSGGNGFDFQYTDLLFMEDCIAVACAGDGIHAEKFERGLIDTILATAITGDGVNVDTMHLSELNWIFAYSNTGDGMDLSNVDKSAMYNCTGDNNGGHGTRLNTCNRFSVGPISGESNTLSGLYITNVTDCVFDVCPFSNNSEYGAYVTNSDNNSFRGLIIKNNTLDGIRLNDTSDANLISSCQFLNNSAYGLNIAASTCDNTVVTACSFSGNTSSAVNDLGTGTQIGDNNLGLTFQEIKKHWRARNISGGTLNQGETVVYAIAEASLGAPAIADLPQSASIVSRWLLDEASGNRSDSVGSNTLTDNNTVLSGDGYSGSLYDYVTSGDFERDTSEYLSLADGGGMDPAGSFTFSMWVKFESIGANTALFSKWGASGQRGYQCFLQSDNKIQFAITSDGTSGTEKSVITDGTYSAGVWYHLTFVFEASTRLTIYVNGSEVKENTTSIPAVVFDCTKQFEIGGSSTDGFYMDGLIQDVTFWSAALTDAEVDSLA